MLFTPQIGQMYNKIMFPSRNDQTKEAIKEVVDKYPGIAMIEYENQIELWFEFPISTIPVIQPLIQMGIQHAHVVDVFTDQNLRDLVSQQEED